MTFLPVLFPLLTAGCTLGAVLAFRQARGSSERLRRARRAQGVVTHVEYNVSLQPFPTVRFSTDEGRAVQAQPQSSSNAVRFSEGQSVGLRYDPDDPQWVVVDGLPSAPGTGYAAAALLSFAAVVIATAWWLVG